MVTLAKEDNKRKIRVGRVVSDKMDKTVVVAVEFSRPHRLYKKRVRRISKFKNCILQTMESKKYKCGTRCYKYQWETIIDR